MVFKTQFPAKTNRISLQAWDKDVISANDFISEGTLDYTELAEEAFLYNQAVTVEISHLFTALKQNFFDD